MVQVAQRSPTPVFPTPEVKYNALNEAEFRKEVEITLENITELAAQLKTFFAVMLSTGSETIAAASTAFVGIGAQLSTSLAIRIPVPIDCTLDAMFVHSRADAGATPGFDYTVFKNGVAITAAKCSITGATSTCSVTGLSESFTAGDEVSIEVVVGAGAAATGHHIGLRFKTQ